MLDGINEFAEADSQRRWMIRRLVVSFAFMLACYVGSWLPMEHYVKTRNTPEIVSLRPFVLSYYRPLDVLCRPPLTTRWVPTFISEWKEAALQLAERSCHRVDSSIGGWSERGYPVSTVWVIAVLLGLVLAYALSPVPLLWVIKFLGIEKVMFVARLFEWHCAPIEWVNDHSATARSFYEEYAELFAVTH